jgi:CO dehydrogenase/acetyl-CoA synthase beta subunit
LNRRSTKIVPPSSADDSEEEEEEEETAAKEEREEEEAIRVFAFPMPTTEIAYGDCSLEKFPQDTNVKKF